MSSDRLTELASKVFRTGKQTLYARSDGHFFVRLENRTNDTMVEIPASKVEEWRRLLAEAVAVYPGGRV